MELEKIESVIRLMRAYGLHELEIKEDGESLRLVQSPSTTVPAQSAFMSMPAMPPMAGMPMMPMAAEVKAHGGTSSHSAEDNKVTKPSRDANLREVRSPFVGTYYASSSPGADPFVTLNKPVRKGDTLCIIEAMKLMNEIEAERDGVIVEILVENEQPVEYDQVLFLMK